MPLLQGRHPYGFLCTRPRQRAPVGEVQAAPDPALSEASNPQLQRGLPRPGIGCQQLRANAALIIEWLRVLLRWGQLPAVAAVTKTSDNGLTERMRRLRAQRQDAVIHKRSKSPPGPIQLTPG